MFIHHRRIPAVRAGAAQEGRTAITSVHGTARYGWSDTDAVVEAAFMCGICLGPPMLVIFQEGDESSTATCHCSVCATPTEITLDPEQALRLLLSPPSGLFMPSMS